MLSRGLSSLLPSRFRFSRRLVPVDGNGAAAHVAYHMSEAAFIYPITPSTPMGELYDEWSSKGRKNVFDRVPVCHVLQSEAGAAGALHGAAAVGTFCTTFTASQGLLLMIPNMLKTAGELWPAVFHVASRTVSTQALSIQGDHADIMCVKNTGFAFLASGTIQECQDLAAIAHMSTVIGQIPFLHFFEGFRLSHEIDSIEQLTPDEMRELMPVAKLEEIRRRALNPAHPVVLGHSQGADAYFQTVELGNVYYDRLSEIVEGSFQKFGKLTGRFYKLFDYYGEGDAEDVIVIMGAGVASVKECIDLMKGEKVGVLIPRLYRPWNMSRFIEALPATVKRISVLDRSKDPAAHGEPLFMDVTTTLNQMNHSAQCFGGRYGLASREFTPFHAKAVFDNMRQNSPKKRFTVGITDDVTFLSLPPGKFDGPNRSNKTTQCIFWGLGGDGTIGANKAAIKASIDEKNIYAQGYFAYSADKSNSLTRSYLRFSCEPIQSHYNISQADFIGCTLPGYVTQYRMAEGLKEGGTFLLNFPWSDIESLNLRLPAELKKTLAKKKAKLYIVNATDIAMKCGLRNKISTVIQASFYQLSKVLGDNWLPITEKWIEQEYGRLGDDIVKRNKMAAGMTPSQLKEVRIPEFWANPEDDNDRFKSKSEISFLKEATHPIPQYKTDILDPAFRMTSAALPVSAFVNNLGGVSPLGSTRWVKKGLSMSAPQWNSKSCVQCNACSAVCPHSVIRPFLLSDSELKNVPAQLQSAIQTIQARGADIKDFQYTIQCSPYDCVNCELCIAICPTKSLQMVPVSGSDTALDHAKLHNDLYIYLTDSIPDRGGKIKDKFTVRGSQFQQPQIEFPGSCQGCNETMVTKILTQLFGKRLIIANASGCSSVWGGSFTKVPFVTDRNGRGPAWARSLFEDNAEFGFGMAIGLALRRRHLHQDVESVLLHSKNLPAGIQKVLSAWHENWQNGDLTLALESEVTRTLETAKHIPELEVLQGKKDLWVCPSHWILGGDGWAYDIGFGGLDHVMASGKNFNVLVFDNEIYANTGGQQSKATQIGAVAQFAALGKDTAKKDLGFMMMNYGNIYVASVALGTQRDLQFLIRCLREAESFDGPSLVLCYCNCIMHNIKGAVGAGGAAGFRAHQLAVEGGYWPVYSFDPRREGEGKNPFELMSKAPNEEKLDEFLNMEVRFNSLVRKNPKLAAELREGLHRSLKRRYRIYENFSRAFEPVSK